VIHALPHARKPEADALLGPRLPHVESAAVVGNA
jgi:hypothetical protein